MLNFAFFVFGICRQENRQLFVVVLQSFLTTMCRKVQPSIFISKRKRLINWKCYTKDSFSFTSLFISLKSALFPLLSCSHSTLRNTTCMLYQSAHPQISLQPNIASRSFLKTNILLLPHLTAWKTLQKRPGYFADTWQPAQKRCAFPEEKLQKVKCASHWGTLGRWGPSQAMRPPWEWGLLWLETPGLSQALSWPVMRAAAGSGEGQCFPGHPDAAAGSGFCWEWERRT